MEKRIIIAGSGGQGILFLGRVLAHSAVKQGLEVTWFPSYGAEMRGGTANCMVVVSDQLIGSPIVKFADFLIVLNQASLRKFSSRVAKDGSLIYDLSIIPDKISLDNIKIYPIEASKEAAQLSNPKLANMILLGSFIKISKLIDIEKVLETIEEIVKAKRKEMIEINKNLIMRGFSLVED